MNRQIIWCEDCLREHERYLHVWEDRCKELEKRIDEALKFVKDRNLEGTGEVLFNILRGISE